MEKNLPYRVGWGFTRQVELWSGDIYDITTYQSHAVNCVHCKTSDVGRHMQRILLTGKY